MSEFGHEIHGFNVGMAVRYGRDEAIVLNRFIFMISSAQRAERNFKDGRTWVYDTEKDIAVHFPYFTQHQIRRIIKSLVTQDVLITGNYNKASIDKTLWHAFKNEEMFTK